MEKDLRKRGVLAKDEPRPAMLDFALMLIGEYVKYPVDSFHSAWFPYNYCMLPMATTNVALRGFLARVMGYFC